MDFLNVELFTLNRLLDFHFIRPWLLSLIPITVLAWVVLRRLNGHSQWQDHLPKATIETLQIRQSSSSNLTQWAWLITWVCISVAAAGPSWLKQAVPVMQNQNATVIVLDLSLSMLAKDLTPNRLTLAKYKLIDALRRGSNNGDAETQRADGQFALIAYSGDAYTVSPLTDDPKTIESLLPALHPNVMPAIGSNVEAAIAQANVLFKDAGIVSGQILLLTDGIDQSAFKKMQRALGTQHSLAILGVGRNEAAPVPLNDGGFLRKANGEIVLAALNAHQLQKFSHALGAKFAQISADERDLDFLLSDKFVAADGSAPSAEQDRASFDAWVDMGHWLVIIMLPIFVMFFRKGLIYTGPLLVLSAFVSPNNAYAVSTWDKLWKNSDQIGAELIAKEDYAGAAESFNNHEWSAVAAYKNADYATTLKQLEGRGDAVSLYNSGNALALTGELDKAIEFYQQALALKPEFTNAQHNLDVLEQLKKQSEQKQPPSDTQSGDNKDSEQQDSNQESPNQPQNQPSQQQTPDNGSEQESDPQSPAEQNASEPEEPEEPEEAEEAKNASEGEGEGEAQNETKESETPPIPEEGSDDIPSGSLRPLAESPEPLKDSSEQWLRSIEDNPSEFLRRKFQYQNQQRQQQGQRSRQQKDDSGQQRY